MHPCSSTFAESPRVLGLINWPDASTPPASETTWFQSTGSSGPGGAGLTAPHGRWPSSGPTGRTGRPYQQSRCMMSPSPCRATIATRSITMGDASPIQWTRAQGGRSTILWPPWACLPPAPCWPTPVRRPCLLPVKTKGRHWPRPMASMPCSSCVMAMLEQPIGKFE